MKKVKLLKTVEGLPYKLGDTFIVSEGRFSLVWHVWNTHVRLPEGSYEVVG